MNITEKPDNWVILKIENEYYKVFASYRESWKLNSGIKEVTEDTDYYYFIGFSGSCYKCKKDSYGTASNYTQGILNNILNNTNGQVELLSDCTDWKKYLNL